LYISNRPRPKNLKPTGPGLNNLSKRSTTLSPKLKLAYAQCGERLSLEVHKFTTRTLTSNTEASHLTTALANHIRWRCNTAPKNSSRACKSAAVKKLLSLEFTKRTLASSIKASQLTPALTQLKITSDGDATRLLKIVQEHVNQQQ